MIKSFRPFLDLLPSRIEQALISRSLRKLRVAWERGTKPRQVEQTSENPGRLFVDLAVISRHDAGTGIQRVVRALALALIEEAQSDWEVHFVSADRRRAYHGISWPNLGAAKGLSDINCRPGDVFLGLDFSLDTIRFHRRQLARFKRDGGRLWFLVCDLLPADHPEWFSPNNVVRYKAWLYILARMADGFLCISRQTEDDLRRVLSHRFGLASGFLTSVVPMGYAIKESLLDVAAGNAAAQMRFDPSKPFSLMVGTLEPRKGHADILGGFNLLWQEGLEIGRCKHRLVLVGRPGWHTEDLQDIIRTHPEYGHNLMWFDDVEDGELERIYEACSGVIIGSHAEGFGLPLIEALGHNKPVLARDIPIFREHEDLGVRYFPANADALVLARSIRKWTEDVQAGRIVVLRPSAGWKEAASVVLSAIT